MSHQQKHLCRHLCKVEQTVMCWNSWVQSICLEPETGNLWWARDDCGGASQGLLHDLCEKKTRSCKAAHSSTCLNIWGTDKKCSACIKTLFISWNRELYSRFSLCWDRKPRILMLQKAQDFVCAILTWCVGCRSYVSETLWSEEK